MNSEGRISRLAGDPATVECPICRHRQWLSARAGRCDQCGSDITLFESREEAARALDDLTGRGRLAYLRDVEPELFAVIANRAFGGREER